MTESTNGVSTTTGQDSIFSDLSTHRLRVINNGASSSVPLATFPCATSQGCIVYAGGSTSPYVETMLTFTTVTSGVTAGLPLLQGSTAPGWGGAGLDLQGYPIVNEMTGATGANAPVQYELVIISTGSASTVQIATTTTTTGIEGICAANCSSGATNAQITRSGIASCKFDAATSIGDYVVASTTSGDGGYCHDAGSSYPFTGAQVLGRVLSSCLSGANCAMLLYPGGISPVTLGTITGTLAIANGGTGQTSASNSFNALSPMTTLGDLIIGGTSGAGTRLAGNTTTTPKYLKSLGSGGSATAETWTQVAAADLSDGTTGSGGNIVLATGPTVSAPSLTGVTTVKRISVANGTTQTSGNITLSSNWNGSGSASVGTVAGSDTALTFTVTAGSGTPTSNGTITVTFADGTFTTNPICILQNTNSSSGSIHGGIKQSTLSATQIVFTDPTAATGSASYVFNVICFHQ